MCFFISGSELVLPLPTYIRRCYHEKTQWIYISVEMYAEAPPDLGLGAGTAYIVYGMRISFAYNKRAGQTEASLPFVCLGASQSRIWRITGSLQSSLEAT